MTRLVRLAVEALRDGKPPPPVAEAGRLLEADGLAGGRAESPGGEATRPKGAALVKSK